MHEEPAEQSRDERTAADELHERPRRPYVAPALITYGSLARLTRNGHGSGSDGGGVMSMVCL